MAIAGAFTTTGRAVGARARGAAARRGAATRATLPPAGVGAPAPVPTTTGAPPPAGGASRSPASRRAPRGRAGARGGWESRFDAGAREVGRLRLTPPRRLTARDGAGFLGGLLLYVLGLNYLRHGPEGVKGWLGAKFLNRPYVAESDVERDDDVDERDRKPSPWPDHLFGRGANAPRRRRNRRPRSVQT